MATATPDPEALLDFWFQDCDRDAARLSEAAQGWFARGEDFSGSHVEGAS